MKLHVLDTISMEPFQQYLAEKYKFTEDGKCSTSGVAHKLDLTVNACWTQRLVYESGYARL